MEVRSYDRVGADSRKLRTAAPGNSGGLQRCSDGAPFWERRERGGEEWEKRDRGYRGLLCRIIGLMNHVHFTFNSPIPGY